MAFPPSSLSVRLPDRAGSSSKLTREQSIDFVIPDEDLLQATDAINAVAGVSVCQDPEHCEALAPCRGSPIPLYHAHIDGSELTIELHVQRDALSFLAPLHDLLPTMASKQLPSGFLHADDRSKLLARRVTGESCAFAPTQHPVIIVEAYVLLESYMRSYARDLTRWFRPFYGSMIAYIELYVDKAGLLDVSKVPLPLRKCYQALHADELPMGKLSRALQQALGDPAVG